MYSDDELLPISGLQHVLFCTRRAFLVHAEQLWGENIHTAQGGIAHERVHHAPAESRGHIIIARGLRLRSYALGLTGIADVVEFRESGTSDEGCCLPSNKGRWIPFPIEYKSGSKREEIGYEAQLCAQAICLEEMLHVNVPEGALFYGASKRRLEVVFTSELREITQNTARLFRELLDSGVTPTALYENKCEKCSLLSQCMPKTAGGGKSAAAWLVAQVNK